MKTLFKIWLVLFILYSATSVVMAEGVKTADFVEVWTGFSEGNMCITVKDTIDKSDASAELWLVTNDEVEWIRDLEGFSCFDVDVGEESQLHILTYDPRIIISVARDTVEQTLLSQL